MDNLTTPNATNWQTKQRGTHEDEFDIFLHCADDGAGGDVTRDGAPLPTFEEWLAR
tara:strand:- start:474 stop:641 length:168 start_codon:yes stop_codon:yes gene_type:complete